MLAPLPTGSRGGAHLHPVYTGGCSQGQMPMGEQSLGLPLPTDLQFVPVTQTRGIQGAPCLPSWWAGGQRCPQEARVSRTGAGKGSGQRVSTAVSGCSGQALGRRTTAWKLHLPQGMGRVSCSERWSPWGAWRPCGSFATPSAKALRDEPSKTVSSAMACPSCARPWPSTGASTSATWLGTSLCGWSRAPQSPVSRPWWPQPVWA